MTEALHLESPAKVNLRLEILKKREDGYHELRTILQKIDLHDTLDVSIRKGRGIVVIADHPGLPVGKGNLVYQAAESILNQSNFNKAITIKIDKRIPLGAGLGGGSSNAAATLKAVDRLLGLNLSEEELKGIGLGIGADVPFFLTEGPAIGSGIGERLKKIRLPPLWFILIYPNFEVSTRWAYQHFVLTKRQFRPNIRKFIDTPEGIVKILRNDLEGPVMRRYAQIGLMKEVLSKAGAMGALMTGSGPTVFGIFSEEGSVLKAFKRVNNLVRGKGWSVLKAHSLPV